MSALPYNPLKEFEFIPIPLVIDRRNDLKSISKRVYGYYLKCYGKDGDIFPTAAAIANGLGKSRKTINEGIKELKEKNLIYTKKKGIRNRVFFNKLNEDGYPASVTPSVTDSVTPGVTDSVTPGVTIPIIKDKEKKKTKEKSGATPDSFNNFHPYIDEIMAAIPKVAKGRLSKIFINKCLWEKEGDRPYFYWLFDKCCGKNDPARWIAGGLINYYSEYL